MTDDVAAAADPGSSPDGGCGDIGLGEGLHAVRSDAQPNDARPDDAQLPDAQPPARVTAVLVCRDGAAYLPRTLSALAAQTRAPDAVRAVDAGSRDDSPHLLATALPDMIRLERRCSFSAAVDAALTAQVGPDEGGAGAGRQAHSDAGTGAHRDDGWLWLLHDDCAPRPDALERLLAAVETAPSVGVAGCKQVDWDDDQRILDVGLTTTRGGARVSVADRNEVDQGQHDERSDVLAVSTAGMLVRRDLWTRLGGADPTLAHARDDLDLGRRAHLAGHRVVVVPGAVVAHAAAWATGRRPDVPSWWQAERRDCLHLRLASIALPLTPLVLCGRCWPRCLGRPSRS
jgi:GT2 family glycosyltransferase